MKSSVPCCACWATRIGCKLCLQQQRNGGEIPAKDPALAVRAGERTVLHGEILHEAEAKKGRENRKVRGGLCLVQNTCRERARGKTGRKAGESEQHRTGTCRGRESFLLLAFPTYISILSTLIPQHPVTASKATYEDKYF